MSIAKVLLVDDETSFLAIMEKRLSSRNLDVRTADSGAKALEILGEDDTIDVVILDVKMPGMDGVQALQEIRTRFPLAEVVMLTGHATIETAIDGMKKRRVRLPDEALRHRQPDPGRGPGKRKKGVA
eukprot:TRINITY_DN15911_c0_g1_i1.p2 TRINITY_DN15911_c0_g1~~TRINITY_DN15911_c0_g1_i1.p2  ORF type:complete len:127 (+),score=25.47 TRINITY_DN15911_c0_g1_i1:195-575(+)